MKHKTTKTWEGHIRLSVKLKDHIQQIADRERRCLTAQIETLLMKASDFKDP